MKYLELKNSDSHAPLISSAKTASLSTGGKYNLLSGSLKRLILKPFMPSVWKSFTLIFWTPFRSAEAGRNLKISTTRGLLAMVCLTTSTLLYAETALNAQNNLKYDVRSKMIIGILGDSLSAGFGLKAGEGWVALLAQKIKSKDLNAEVINVSVSGATTDAGLQMQAGLKHHQPDIVIIELGANDGLQGKPLALIRQNLSTMIATSQSWGATVLLVGMKLPPNLGKRYTEPFFANYAELAIQHKVKLVPFFLDGVAGDETLMQTDGLHPNSAAQPLLLNTIWAELEALIKNHPLAHSM